MYYNRDYDYTESSTIIVNLFQVGCIDINNLCFAYSFLGCLTDAHCSGETPACNVDTHMCVGKYMCMSLKHDLKLVS